MKKIPEDNKYFHYYNANPKGKDTNDCVYRALSLFLNVTWEEIAELDARYYLEHGKFLHEADGRGALSHPVAADYLDVCDKSKKVYEFNLKDGISTMRDFIDRMADSDKVYICPLERHIAVIKDNKVWDTWDSSKGGIGAIYERI